MIEKENFNVLVERVMKTTSFSHMRPVIEKELLLYDILFILDEQGLLDTLTFQGGTALRLCYGAPRFSEDLDFTGGEEFNLTNLLKIKSCIQDYIGSRYGLEISVKEPKEMLFDSQNEEIAVSKWQISIALFPEKKDLPKQRIKIEVVNINSYSRTPKALQINYDFLPDGYGDVLILTENLEEIMADKLIAFVNCQKYIRYRDLWDLRWLLQQGAKLNPEYVLQKIADYRITDYPKKLSKTLSQLDSLIKSNEFRQEMSRFLPMEAQERTLKKEKFLDFLSGEMSSLFLEVQKIIELS